MLFIVPQVGFESLVREMSRPRQAVRCHPRRTAGLRALRGDPSGAQERAADFARRTRSAAPRISDDREDDQTSQQIRALATISPTGLTAARSASGTRGFILPLASAPGNPGENELLPTTVAELRPLRLSPRQVTLDGRSPGRPDLAPETPARAPPQPPERQRRRAHPDILYGTPLQHRDLRAIRLSRWSAIGKLRYRRQRRTAKTATSPNYDQLPPTFIRGKELALHQVAGGAAASSSGSLSPWKCAVSRSRCAL